MSRARKKALPLTAAQPDTTVTAKGLKIRKKIEDIFGWAKTVDPLRQTKFRDLKKVSAQTIFTFAAYNLTRVGAIFGCCYSSV
jgi:hypothetical protein